MLRRMENESISLNFRSIQTHERFDFMIRAIIAEDLMEPGIIQRDKKSQWLTVGGSWISILIGSYFRLIMYRYVYEMYKKKEFLPINKLIIVVALVQHLNQVNSALTTTLIVLNEDSLDHVFGGLWYCYFSTILIQFSVCYSFFGSLGVSIYRILLIKHSNWLKDVIGEKVMLNIILFGGIILTVFSLILFNFHDFMKLRYETCMIVNKMLIFRILDDYDQSRGNSSPLSNYINVALICTGVVLLATISEIIIYVTFFHHMYKHDNNDRLRRLIEPSVIRYRNRSNAISFFGQFCSFAFNLITSILFVFAIQFGNPQNVLYVVTLTIWRLKFSAMAMIEVLTSNQLRAKLFQIHLFDIIFGLW